MTAIGETEYGWAWLSLTGWEAHHEYFKTEEAARLSLRYELLDDRPTLDYMMTTRVVLEL